MSSPRATTVDPATMTPALNPNYAPWTCVVAGTGITCTGYQDLSYTNDATDLQCNGKVVYVTGTQRSKLVRWHDLDGRALKTSIQTNFPADRLTLSPTGAGAAVFLSGDWHKHYVYPVPGDLTQRVLTETGSALKLRVPGEGVTFRDSGTVTYVPCRPRGADLRRADLIWVDMTMDWAGTCRPRQDRDSEFIHVS